MNCEIIPWAKVESLCLRLADAIRISEYHPGLVIAIARGGYVPARMLCDYLHLQALTSIKIEHYVSGSEKQFHARIRYPIQMDVHNLRILLVDDVNDTGETLEVAMKHLRHYKPAEIRTAVLHNKAVTKYPVDYHAEEVIEWRWLIYPWALYEDVCGFIERMSPRPENLEEARARLIRQYNIELSINKLRKICASKGVPVTD